MLKDLTFCVATFGCQMNKHDSERVSGMLQAAGMRPVRSMDDADVVVFMTCCVRERADERLYGQVASMKNLPVRDRSRLGKRFVCVGGCIGQRDGEGLLDRLGHVDLVFGTHNLDDLVQLLQEAIDKRTRLARTKDGRSEFHDDLPEVREKDWAAWLPITVGCNNFCTYCVVPLVRGREISRPFEEVERQAHAYVEAGVKEITLLGQNVNSYGRDLYGSPRFAEVLHAVSASGVERIRFATSHPKDLLDEVVDCFGSLPNLMPAIHLPVQSGSDKVLAAMNRRYTTEHYLSLVDSLRRACPKISLSTDVIVGFPGETEEDFQQTCELIASVGYTQVFSFIYSKREGTPAAQMPDDTPREVIADRFERLRSIVEEGAFACNKRFEGGECSVLFESFARSEQDKGFVASGKSAHNVTVHVAGLTEGEALSLVGTIAPVRVTQSKTWYLNGALI